VEERRSPAILASLALTLVAFGIVAYGPRLALPFSGDDYVYLDRVLHESFADVWSRHHVDFGWFRPWSRDFHFWIVAHVFGTSAVAFRCINLALWTGGMVLYAALVLRVAGPSIAAIATLGAATLALWATPLVWVSGVQDLWMLCFTMASLLCFVSGRMLWSVVALVGGLLSKETASVLPAIALCYCLIVDRMKFGQALWRVSTLGITVVAWVLLHPTLLHPSVSTFHRYAPPTPPTFILATVNLDRWPRPIDFVVADVVMCVVGAAILSGSLAWLLGRLDRTVTTSKAKRTPDAAAASALRSPRSLWVWGLSWGLIGVLPTLVPSTGWHPYYYCVGALGVWLAFAVWLRSRPSWAIAIVAVLAFVRGAVAWTASYDWGSEAYFVRSGKLLSLIHAELLREHPSLPSHTRVYMARVPNNIGLIAGQASALQVWYRDHTVTADFYNGYRPRTYAEPSGDDLFFRFDPDRILVEIVPGPENIGAAMAANPEWQDDHEKLSMLFLRSGDLDRAAEEFEKLSQLPNATQATMYASVCRLVQGNSTRSDSLLRSAQQGTSASWAEMVGWRERLVESMPGPARADATRRRSGSAPEGPPPSAARPSPP
jgi:hypothetical protein